MISYGICLFLSDLLSLNMVIYRSIHVAADGIIPFLFFMAELLLIVSVHHIFSFYSSVSGTVRWLLCLVCCK